MCRQPSRALRSMKRGAVYLQKATLSGNHLRCTSPQCTTSLLTFLLQGARPSHRRFSSAAFWRIGLTHGHTMLTRTPYTMINDMGMAVFLTFARKLVLLSMMDPHSAASHLEPGGMVKPPNLHFQDRPGSTSMSGRSAYSLVSNTAKFGFISSAKHVELELYRHFHNGSGISSLLEKATSLPSTRFLKPDCGRMHGPICGFSRTHMGHAHDHHEHKHGDDTGEAGERVSRLGLIADICLTAGKGFAGYASGSTAVIADAAHSMSDVVLSGVALWIFKAARAPKDQMHPYGHGKFETLGALGISSMLLLTGGGIAWHAFEALQGLLSATDATSLVSDIQSGAEHANTFKHDHTHGGHHHGIDKEHQSLALIATVISIGVKEGLFWVTKKVGDARGSELLKANAWHHRSDAISSVIALLGVGGAILGWHFLDPLAGLLVSGLIFRAGLQTGYRSLQELVDSALPEFVLSPFKETVMSVKGVKGCHALRGRKAGSSIHLDVHIEVDPWLSVSAAHMIGETARQKLREQHSSLEEVFIHVEPADAFAPSMSSHNPTEDSKCNGHMQTDKPYQQQEVEKVVRGLVQSDFDKVMAFERVRCHFLQGRLLVELEVSMEPTLTIRDGMHHARKAEELIMKACPKISAVETQLRLTRYS